MAVSRIERKFSALVLDCDKKFIWDENGLIFIQIQQMSTKISAGKSNSVMTQVVWYCYRTFAGALGWLSTNKVETRSFIWLG